MKYLLDTNICLYLIKKKPADVLVKFRGIPLGEIGVSAITVAELEYGVEKSRYLERNRPALDLFLAPLEIVAFDQAAARQAGIIRTALEKAGTPIGAYDILIAGHAKSLEVTLVTHNLKEFKRIESLKIENWADSSR
jgi:tRNA(fMet)-specific endonuclease VapC